MAKPLYQRILLKLSGESLMGDVDFGIDPAVLDRMAVDIAEIVKMGVQVGVVIGGGNLYRGATLSEAGLKRVTGDHMGMLATVMNALAMRDALERIDLPGRVMSAIPMSGIADYYDRRKAIHHMREGRVVLFAAGTGNPFFTTDSAACLRAIEIDAEIVLKATKVDGVYSADPVKDPSATMYKHLTYEQVINQGLQVMDHTAICLSRDYEMPLRVFNIRNKKSLKEAVLNADLGTLVSQEPA